MKASFWEILDKFTARYKNRCEKLSLVHVDVPISKRLCVLEPSLPHSLRSCGRAGVVKRDGLRRRQVEDTHWLSAYAGSNASYISLYLYESPAVHTITLLELRVDICNSLQATNGV